MLAAMPAPAMIWNPFSKTKAARVSPQRSTRELMDARKRNRCELRASVYLYRHASFIVCCIADIAEYGEPIVLDADVPDEQLGLGVCDQLLNYKPRINRDLSKSTLEDWPAYQVSGAKSGRSFEENCMFVYVTTINTAINIQASPRLSNEKELVAQCSIANGREHSEMGATIRKAIRAAEVLRDAGML